MDNQPCRGADQSIENDKAHHVRESGLRTPQGTCTSNLIAQKSPHTLRKTPVLSENQHSVLRNVFRVAFKIRNYRSPQQGALHRVDTFHVMDGLEQEATGQFTEPAVNSPPVTEVDWQHPPATPERTRQRTTLITSRNSISRGLPRRPGRGIKGSIRSHSSSVMSDG